MNTEIETPERIAATPAVGLHGVVVPPRYTLQKENEQWCVVDSIMDGDSQKIYIMPTKPKAKMLLKLLTESLQAYRRHNAESSHAAPDVRHSMGVTD